MDHHLPLTPLLLPLLLLWLRPHPIYLSSIPWSLPITLLIFLLTYPPPSRLPCSHRRHHHLPVRIPYSSNFPASSVSAPTPLSCHLSPARSSYSSASLFLLLSLTVSLPPLLLLLLACLIQIRQVEFLIDPGIPLPTFSVNMMTPMSSLLENFLIPKTQLYIYISLSISLSLSLYSKYHLSLSPHLLATFQPFLWLQSLHPLNHHFPISIYPFFIA